MGGSQKNMPLSKIQKDVLLLLSDNRSEESHLAGATGIHLNARSPRKSIDLDIFHDAEEAVAKAFEDDRVCLEAAGYTLETKISQPGFIRALITSSDNVSLLIDWAHDSAWRFMPPINIAGVGYVLHPVDLAVNKILALAGRSEPRDFVDVIYLHENYISLVALVWAASGKDGGMNPDMLLDLLKRKSGYRQEDIDRLNMDVSFDLAGKEALFRAALLEAEQWIRSRPPDELGCLYRKPGTLNFFMPKEQDVAEVHYCSKGGVIPRLTNDGGLYQREEAKLELEKFFGQKIM